MNVTRKKLFYLSLLWVVLAIFCISILKNTSSVETKKPFSWFAQKRLEAIQNKAFKLLNMSMPTSELYQFLMKINATGRGSPPAEIASYFQQIIDLMPRNSEGYLVLGFCKYYSNSKEEAFELFQKSFFLDPQYYWINQNLAIMSVEAGRTDLAEKFFTLALQQNPRHALEIMRASKIFKDILIADQSYNPAIAMEEDYIKASKALIMLQKHIPFELKDLDLHVRIF